MENKPLQLTINNSKASDILQSIESSNTVRDRLNICRNLMDLLSDGLHLVKLQILKYILSRLETCLTSIKLKDLVKTVENDEALLHIIKELPEVDCVRLAAIKNKLQLPWQIYLSWINIQNIFREFRLVLEWNEANLKWSSAFGKGVQYFNISLVYFQSQITPNNILTYKQFSYNLGPYRKSCDIDSKLDDLLMIFDEFCVENKTFFTEKCLTESQFKSVIEMNSQNDKSDSNLHIMRCLIDQIFIKLTLLPELSFGDLIVGVTVVRQMMIALKNNKVHVDHAEIPLLTKCLRIAEFCSYRFIISEEMEMRPAIGGEIQTNLFLELVDEFRIHTCHVLNTAVFSNSMIMEFHKRILPLSMLVRRSIFHRENEFYDLNQTKYMRDLEQDPWIGKFETYPTEISVRKAYSENNNNCFICLENLTDSKNVILAKECEHLCCTTCFYKWFQDADASILHMESDISVSSL